jgi:hypothetical protein
MRSPLEIRNRSYDAIAEPPRQGADLMNRRRETDERQSFDHCADRL